MEFFGATEGTVVTFDTRDTISSRGKRIEAVPAWKWLENRPEESGRERDWCIAVISISKGL
jgi:hypothetical protein